MRARQHLLLCALGVLNAALPSGQQAPPAGANNPLAASPTAAAEGQTQYNQLCQTCHGPAGQGGGDRGPALNTGTFAHGSGDADLFRAIRSGVRGTQMPPFAGLTDTQVWQLVTYLRSLQSTSSIATTASTTSGDAGAGETLFFGRAGCVSCHEVNARGGIVGPDLSNAGRLSSALLEQKIVNPNGPGAASAGGRGGRGGATPATAIVKTLDGREIRGVRRNEDTFSLQMTDLAGQLRMFDKRQLSSVVIDGSSLHPRDYATRLSGGEIANLVAYLRTRQG